ncbi:DNase I-like protein [Teratosphaeria destructans]|uniref:DNase I-like protein n=1 Tax=Teratosphaeria destructans TaxID=418781 RepID=A0A9W7SI54_9PEZI|nr:DNase I-like protein [Teratosphaeria destructans]
MAHLNVYLTTFNAARSPINIDYFAANLFNSLHTDLPPDLIVLSLQEIAPIAYSFLGGSWLAPYLVNFSEAIYRAATARFGKDSRYVSVIARNVGLTGILVFARPEVESRIRWIETGGVGCGLWDMGNKGAVGVRLGWSDGGDEAANTFVAAHLAPMEENWERRNADWKSICERLVFERVDKGTGTAPPHKITNGDDDDQEPLLSPDTTTNYNEHSMFTPPTYLFFAGDLNYRTSDTKPSPSAPSHDSWPQPVDAPSDPKHITQHLSHDQLSRELSKGNTLHLLTEAPITFAPTYKYSSAAQANVAALAMPREVTETLADGRTVHRTVGPERREREEEVWLWAKHRVPSWCDRILYLQNMAQHIQVRAYAALPIQPTSDHRPVVLSCAVPMQAIEETVKPPFPIKKDWKQRRAMARRLEVVVGVGAYLTLTWEGRILLAGTVVGLVGGYFALVALLG